MYGSRWVAGLEVSKMVVLKFLRERCRDALGQVMGFKRIKIGKSVVGAFIQHYGAVQ